MTKFLLTVHVLAAILAVGPVAVAASMFPAAARRLPDRGATDRGATDRGTADQDAAEQGTQTGGVAALRVLHRICRVYAVAGLAVPVFGFATASSLGVLRDAWVIASILLTAAAAGVLTLAVLPRQDAVLARLAAGDSTPADAGGGVASLAMLTGVFNLLWAAVTVLMIVRPGSTTGV
ncbi:hypothetical protein SAMN05421833_106183 [Microbispora rosea]|uniref:Integral membrane protein DUF2269 n=1 Tax=Microbispora rosea TaxID=58117 RepID=A0A1N6YKM8_9ACTN|nr:hypothetical protein [Microbispora rosea]GIH47049.1 membrane protein [Microbispora rosea subsp. rosea]SIR15163.1 hypothetical protein SAMN05421833_106183 [Microbispora rosea]